MWRKAVRFLLWSVGVFAVFCGIVYLAFDPWTIPGDDAQFAVSVEPALSVADVVLVARTKGASDGALVRCLDPDAASRFVVGRVVAHGGDVVEFTGGTLFVNGKVASTSLACEPATVHLKNPATQEDEELTCMLEDLGGALHPILREGKGAHDSKTTVEPGKAYVVSDNRLMHLDSRDFASVDPSTCQRIVYRLWGASGWLDRKKRLTILW
jgi:signal peptidase I